MLPPPSNPQPQAAHSSLMGPHPPPRAQERQPYASACAFSCSPPPPPGPLLCLDATSSKKPSQLLLQFIPSSPLSFLATEVASKSVSPNTCRLLLACDTLSCPLTSLTLTVTLQGRNQHVWRLREVKGLTQGPLSKEAGHSQCLAPEFTAPVLRQRLGGPGSIPRLPCPALLGDLRHTAREVDATQVL